MTGRMLLSIHDDTHDQFADKIEYDLWRIYDNNTKLQTIDDLGCYEIILHVKDYFDKFNENIVLSESQFIIPIVYKNKNKIHLPRNTKHLHVA
ncbi:unnamed protein product [Rotaria magnacalcarata]